MSNVTLIDIGKHTFHLHAQDKFGKEVAREKCSRPQMMRFLANHPPCTVVMEACAGSHCLAREIKAMGHEAKLISPQFVKPFVKIKITPGVRIVVASPDLPETRPRGRNESRCAVLFL